MSGKKLVRNVNAVFEKIELTVNTALGVPVETGMNMRLVPKPPTLRDPVFALSVPPLKEAVVPASGEIA